jgi:hypothetical protein
MTSVMSKTATAISVPICVPISMPMTLPISLTDSMSLYTPKYVATIVPVVRSVPETRPTMYVPSYTCATWQVKTTDPLLASPEADRKLLCDGIQTPRTTDASSMDGSSSSSSVQSPPSSLSSSSTSIISATAATAATTSSSLVTQRDSMPKRITFPSSGKLRYKALKYQTMVENSIARAIREVRSMVYHYAKRGHYGYATDDVELGIPAGQFKRFLNELEDEMSDSRYSSGGYTIYTLPPSSTSSSTSLSVSGEHTRTKLYINWSIKSFIRNIPGWTKSPECRVRKIGRVNKRKTAAHHHCDR